MFVHKRESKRQGRVDLLVPFGIHGFLPYPNSRATPAGRSAFAAYAFDGCADHVDIVVE